MESISLEKEIVKMKLRVYQRVKDIKKKRILKELKSFKIIKSVKMVGDWFITKKIK